MPPGHTAKGFPPPVGDRPELDGETYFLTSKLDFDVLTRTRVAKSDFPSAFITCFVPIIVLYYPLALVAVNLGRKHPALHPARFVLPPVIRH